MCQHYDVWHACGHVYTDITLCGCGVYCARPEGGCIATVYHTDDADFRCLKCTRKYGPHDTTANMYPGAFTNFSLDLETASAASTPGGISQNVMISSPAPASRSGARSVPTSPAKKTRTLAFQTPCRFPVTPKREPRSEGLQKKVQQQQLPSSSPVRPSLVHKAKEAETIFDYDDGDLFRVSKVGRRHTISPTNAAATGKLTLGQLPKDNGFDDVVHYDHLYEQYRNEDDADDLMSLYANQLD